MWSQRAPRNGTPPRPSSSSRYKGSSHSHDDTWALTETLTPDTGGENSLVSISFLILLLPLIDEWRLHLLFTVPKKDRAFWVTPLIWLLYMTIITSMIVSLVSSILIESRMPKFEITRRLWRSGYILATAVTVGTMAGVLATTKLYDLGRKQST